MHDIPKSKRFYIARHGETVFNAAARMQGQKAVHTPLTRTGFAQADYMGRKLAAHIGEANDMRLWSSTAGRALQTLAIIAEHIGADWHQTQVDARLLEIDVGTWSERTYKEIQAETGPIMDVEHHLFAVQPPGGESYADIAARLYSWLDDMMHIPGDALIIMHGMSARVLRGILLNLPPLADYKAPIAPSLAQGSMVMISGGVETIIADGAGQGERG